MNGVQLIFDFVLSQILASNIVPVLCGTLYPACHLAADSPSHFVWGPNQLDPTA